jgi:glucose/mannose-6-phosphate isomerase
MHFFRYFVSQNEIVMMDQHIADFSSHLEQALKIGKAKSFKPTSKKIQNVLICGLGGSGIGGSIVAQLVSEVAAYPITTNKDYIIPSFVNENTLVVCCSYSGNTEETIKMYEQAAKKGAEIAIISSGGKFIDIATEKGYNHIQIPAGFPPRAAFGLSFPQLLQVLSFYNIIPSDLESELVDAISLINKEREHIKKEAQSIAKQLHNKMPIIYADASFEGVAVRFRQQINENSKMLCWHHVIPEMNHNELVGWRTKDEELAVVLLRNDIDYDRNKKRMEYNKENIFSKYTSTIIDIHSKGKSRLENVIYHIHLEDWVSFYLADLKNIDAVEVDVITGLKTFLSKI